MWLPTEGRPASYWAQSAFYGGGILVRNKRVEHTAPQLPHFLPPPAIPAPHLGQLLWPIASSSVCELGNLISEGFSVVLGTLFVAVCEIDGGVAVVMINKAEEGCGDEGQQ